MENAGQEIEDEDLAEALREKGIGTPATRADIIENLIKKGYIVRVGKSLRPMVKGIRLVDVLRRVNIDRLASAELTGDLEHQLNQVEKGEITAEDFMRVIVDYTNQIVDRAKTKCTECEPGRYQADHETCKACRAGLFSDAGTSTAALSPTRSPYQKARVGTRVTAALFSASNLQWSENTFG